MVRCAEIVLSQVSEDLLPLFPSPFENFLTISQFCRAQGGEGGPVASSYIGSEAAADIFCSKRERTPYLDSRVRTLLNYHPAYKPQSPQTDRSVPTRKSIPWMNLTQF